MSNDIVATSEKYFIFRSNGTVTEKESSRINIFLILEFSVIIV